ncbi:predicted protein [Chaetoceros tenuissimus]|uniref:Methyltransferase FkbM domain-containing protein n=1 Tax=Chaetoceros tenuissimus TaxID=426638 RepID=A0AAD3CRA2_9STRA|nr:predicted protein [Chaetoceros tenuissimus]
MQRNFMLLSILIVFGILQINDIVKKNLQLLVKTKKIDLTSSSFDSSLKDENYDEHINEFVCGKNASASSLEWNFLCTNHETKISSDAIERMFKSTSEINIVQIGAHVGFEPNDPIAMGIVSLIDSFPKTFRSRFHWTFVEPSPPNYKRLVQNLDKYSHICNMKSINAGVVSDLSNYTDNSLIFYSLKDTIDPETGFDSLSNKTLPAYITQVSSFSKAPILFNRRQFRKVGLNVNDYIVKTKVQTKPFSALMAEVIGNATSEQHSTPFLVLIDTEGFDCDIVQGISFDSKYLPKFLVFEVKQCREKYTKETKGHLEKLGYTLTQDDGRVENIVGVLRST